MPSWPPQGASAPRMATRYAKASRLHLCRVRDVNLLSSWSSNDLGNKNLSGSYLRCPLFQWQYQCGLEFIDWDSHGEILGFRAKILS